MSAFPLAGLGPWLLVFLTIIGACALFLAASSLKKPERRTFCLLVSWLLTGYFPIGTVLGVFTILQLAQSDMYDRLEGRAE